MNAPLSSKTVPATALASAPNFKTRESVYAPVPATTRVTITWVVKANLSGIR